MAGLAGPRAAAETSREGGGGLSGASTPAPSAGPTKGRDERPRWRTLSHHGVLLHPPYKQHGVPVRIVAPDRELRRLPEFVRLPEQAEEMLTEYVRLGGTAAGRQAPRLRGSTLAAERFWADLKPLLEGTPIRGLADIDVSAIRAWLKNAAPAPRGTGRAKPPPQAFAVVDGRRQPVFPYAVERPGIYVGRNASADLTGRIRPRIYASAVTLNLGEGAPVPPPREAWAAIVHLPKVDWIATWQDPVTGRLRYARLAASAPVEQQGTMEKYELAREMCGLLPAYRARSRALLASPSPRDRQLGACLWTIEALGVRVGRAGNDAAHGATTILRRHVSFPDGAASGGRLVRLDFPGKDGVPFVRTVRPPRAVAAAFREAARKPPGRPLFDRISADSVNSAIAEVLPGASAKVVRTCRACVLFEETLLAVERGYGGGGGASARTRPSAPSSASGARAPSRPSRRISRDEARLALQLAYVRTALFCNHRTRCDSASSVIDASLLEPRVDAALAAAAEGRPAADVLRAVSPIIREGCVGMYTARTSYIDTRIIAAFCARNGYPLRRAMYAKSAALPARFKWAEGTPGAFRFCSPGRA